MLENRVSRGLPVSALLVAISLCGLFEYLDKEVQSKIPGNREQPEKLINMYPEYQLTNLYTCDHLHQRIVQIC